MTVCGDCGFMFASAIAKEFSSILVKTVFDLVFAFTHSSSGTATNRAKWSVVLFRMAFVLAHSKENILVLVMSNQSKKTIIQACILCIK